MARIGVLGVTGFTGGLLASALDRRGTPFVAAGRDTDRVRRAVGDLSTVAEVVRVDVTDRSTVERFVADLDVLATTVGPFVELGRIPFGVALAAGCHYVDATGEQPFLRWAYEHDDAGSAAATLIPACGFDSLPGDLLSEVAAAEVADPQEVHVAYLVRGRGALASRGTRRTLAELLPGSGEVLRGGRLVREGFAERRRLAWFPEPVGPHHAAGFPGCEPLMVPRHVDGVEEVGSYLALPTVLAEAGQLVASLARLGAVRRLLRWLLTAGPDHPSAAARRAARWACVAEVASRGGAVARAWAYGHDVYGFTAEALALVAGRLAAGEARATGVRAPAEALSAGDVLDELAEVTDLRWSVRA